MKGYTSKDMHATHMLGNQLNPASSVAQKMSDQLYMEMEAHGVYSMESGAPLIGPMFPGKQLSSVSSKIKDIFRKITCLTICILQINSHETVHQHNRKDHR